MASIELKFDFQLIEPDFQTRVIRWKTNSLINNANISLSALKSSKRKAAFSPKIFRAKLKGN